MKTAGGDSIPDATGATRRAVTVVVPTYREAANLPALVDRLGRVRRAGNLDLELLVMDDDSRDGTEEWVASQAPPWLELVVRRSNRGLSPAVLEGLRRSRRDILVVMDADLSHPPERIPDLVGALDEGADMAFGSRYVPGASTGEDWGVLRWLNSKVATLLARPFTRVRDPMSGFFALRRATLEAARDLNPVGYKIGLELLVKSGAGRVAEIPIHFAQRQRGESKLTLREQLRYLQHVRRLWLFRYPNLAYMAQFGTVGALGVVVNLAVLTLLLAVGAPVGGAVALAIAVSMLFNFALNRRFTFSYARGGSFWKQLVGFVATSLLGALVNYAIVMGLLSTWPALLPQAASVVGVIGGMGINYAFSRWLVFRER